VEKIKNKKILIVGGTGFIGTHLVKKCLDIGLKVTSLSLNKRKKEEVFKKAKYIYADFTKSKLLKKKIKTDFEYIVNLGGYIDHSTHRIKKTKIIKNHFDSTVNLILLKKKKLKRYIHIGSSDEYGYNKSPIKEDSNENPISPYALAKSMSTNLLLTLYNNSNFPVTILRFFLVYGPRQKKDRLIPYVIFNCLNNREILLSHGKQIRDFCYIEDVVEAIILCLKNNKSLGQVFNIGLGKQFSVKQIVKKIIKITGNGKPKFNYFKNKKENLKLYPSIKKINRKLGWKPKISIDEGLRRTVNFFKLNKINNTKLP